METLNDLEIVRALPVIAQLRATDNEETTDGLGLMEVRFSVFNTWYEINSLWEGRFLERILHGAFAKTMAERRPQIVSLFNHGMDFNIGDKVLGPIEELYEAKDSPVGVVRLLDTSYNRDLEPGLRAGVYRSSFMFNAIREEWDDEPEKSDHNPGGLPERTIKEVRLFEFGPVTFPANPDTSSGMRSMTDEYLEHVKRTSPGRYEQLHARALNLRTPDLAGAASRTLASTGAATSNTDPAPTTRFVTPRSQTAQRLLCQSTDRKDPS